MAMQVPPCRGFARSLHELQVIGKFFGLRWPPAVHLHRISASHITYLAAVLHFIHAKRNWGIAGRGRGNGLLHSRNLREPQYAPAGRCRSAARTGSLRESPRGNRRRLTGFARQSVEPGGSRTGSHLSRPRGDSARPGVHRKNSQADCRRASIGPRGPAQCFERLHATCSPKRRTNISRSGWPTCATSSCGSAAIFPKC